MNSIDEAEQLKKERMINNLLKDDMKLLIPYLEEETVTDIAIPDSGEIIVTRFGKGREFTGRIMPDYIAERIINLIVLPAFQFWKVLFLSMVRELQHLCGRTVAGLNYKSGSRQRKYIR